MKLWILAIGLTFSAHVTLAESQSQVFEGRLMWGCLGNWLFQNDSHKKFALLFDKQTLEAHPELVIPSFPIAAAAVYDASIEGTVITEESCYPETPCDWRTWPRSGWVKPDGCIEVTGIRKLEPHKYEK